MEELGYAAEEIAKTRHPKIFIGRLQQPPGLLVRAGVERLRSLAVANEPDASVREALKALVPEALFSAGGPAGAGSGPEAAPGFRPEDTPEAQGA